MLTHHFQLFQIFRKAVRNRFEATRCWQYDYDGLHPPSDASSENKTTTSNYDLNCDITSNCSTPYGSAPVSLTEEEDKEFWSLMRYSCNKITKTWIQISRQNWNCFFSNIHRQMMILLTPIVSWSKTKSNRCRKRNKWH